MKSTRVDAVTVTQTSQTLVAHWQSGYVYTYVTCPTMFGEIGFRSLSCKQNGEEYIARLELSAETHEMELSEMIVLLEQRVNA
jgi:hypothetical protein